MFRTTRRSAVADEQPTPEPEEASYLVRIRIKDAQVPTNEALEKLIEGLIDFAEIKASSERLDK
jgi:hypothetical protein